jgi:hypothetical protein
MRRVLAPAVFFIAAWLTQRQAAADADVGIQTGPLVGVESPALSPRLALGVIGHKLWRPLPELGLGLRASLGLTSLGYGSNDGEPVIGATSGYNPTYLHEALTFIPSLAFAARLRATEAVGVTGVLGASLLISSEMKEFSLFPMPTVGAAVDVRVPSTKTLRARGGVDLISNGHFGLLLCQLGLSWDL